MKKLFSLSPSGSAAALASGQITADQERIRQRLALTLSEKFNLEPQLLTLAWELSGWPPAQTLTPDETMALRLLILLSMIYQHQGSTALPLRTDDNRHILNLLEILAKDDEELASPLFSPEAMLATMTTLIANNHLPQIISVPGGGRVPFLLTNDYLYQEKTFRLEERFIELLIQHLRRPPLPLRNSELDIALSEVKSSSYRRPGQPLVLTARQEAAVQTILRQPFTMVSGGPGTGKTTLIVTVLRTLVRMGVEVKEIALAASTGRAAKRMRESIVERIKLVPDNQRRPQDQQLLELIEPMTIHRLLKYQGYKDAFLFHEQNPLTAKIVIIDETSMVDLWLMDALFSAIRTTGPDATRVVLIGDADQLPSVDAGAVLRDLITAVDRAGNPLLGDRAVRLTDPHRTDRDSEAGNNILQVLTRVNTAQVPNISKNTKDISAMSLIDNIDHLNFAGVEFFATQGLAKPVQAFLNKWYGLLYPATGEIVGYTQQTHPFTDAQFTPQSLASITALFAHLEKFKLLCLTHERKFGVDNINLHFHMKLATTGGLPSRTPVLCGEPVMMTRNDYGRGIFNGDIGIILNVALQNRAPQPMAVFPTADGFKVFSIYALGNEIVHAFAVTVHKAQGSEYNTVGILLPDEDIPLNTREILYTAMSRAKSSVVIVGKPEIFVAGIGRLLPRYSAIPAILVDRI